MTALFRRVGADLAVIFYGKSGAHPGRPTRLGRVLAARWFLPFALTPLVAGLCMCAVIIGVDPLQIRPWGLTPRLIDGNYPELITAKLARAVTEEHQDIILIGSSTAMGPTPRQLREAFAQQRGVNLAYSNPYPIDTGRLIDRALATPGLKRLIVEVHSNLREMNHRPAATGDAAISVLDPRWYALPDFENAIVRASVNRLSSGYFVDPQWARQLSDYANSKRVVDQPQKMREIAAAARKIPPSFFQPVRPMSCSHFAFVAEVMVPAAEKAHAKGVKLDFYFPPIPLATYPVFETRDSLKTAGVDETIFSQLMSFHRCAIIALDRLSREGVKVHAVDTDQSITAHLRYYKDTVHLMDEDKNQRILQDIKGGKYLVTVASLNRYEALLSNQIIANYHRAAR